MLIVPPSLGRLDLGTPLAHSHPAFCIATLPLTTAKVKPAKLNAWRAFLFILPLNRLQLKSCLDYANQVARLPKFVDFGADTIYRDIPAH